MYEAEKWDSMRMNSVKAILSSFYLKASVTTHKLKNPPLDRHCEINSMMRVVYLEIFENKELFRFNWWWYQGMSQRKFTCWLTEWLPGLKVKLESDPITYWCNDLGWVCWPFKVCYPICILGVMVILISQIVVKVKKGNMCKTLSIVPGI